MSKYGDHTKKEFISEQLDYISYKIYNKDWYYLTQEEKVELVGVILSIISDNMIGYDGNFEEPMLEDRSE